MLVVERMVAGTDDGTTWADDANAAAALACTNTRRQNDNLISKEEVENRAGQTILVMSLELAKSGTPLGAWSHATCNRATVPCCMQYVVELERPPPPLMPYVGILLRSTFERT